MSVAPAAYSSNSMRAEKRAVAWNSVMAAVAITTLKIVVGYTTRSLGLRSEAAHSGLDLIAAIVTLLSIRVSDKPADADHQYGHGKVENFSAFIETGLLLLTCVWIVYEAVKRLFFHHVEIEPSAAAFLVIFVSMAVDWWRSRALGKIAKKYDSQALEADALHFSTDIWSSGVVVLGLTLVLVGRSSLGQAYGIGWLRDADPVAALFVAGVVVYVSSRLAFKTVDALLDAAPAESIVAASAKWMDCSKWTRVRILAAPGTVILPISRSGWPVMSRSSAPNNWRTRSPRPSSMCCLMPMSWFIPCRVHLSAKIFSTACGRLRARHNFNVHDVSVQDLQGRLRVERIWSSMSV